MIQYEQQIIKDGKPTSGFTEWKQKAGKDTDMSKMLDLSLRDGTKNSWIHWCEE